MDTRRLKLLPGQQKTFLDKIVSESGLPTKTLAEIVKIHPRSFRDWKKEKLTMTLFAAEKFTILFKVPLPEDKKILVQRWQISRSKANKIGGVAMFKKYGSPGTKEGRRKGGIKSIANLRKNGIIPRIKTYKLPAAFNKELAEYAGIMLGDGGLTSAQATITLNSEADLDYSRFVALLGKKLFGEKPKLYQRKDCKALILYYNGKSLIEYLTNIGLKTGNKVKQQVGVPFWIKNYFPYKIACVRGLMDTDGGVFLHKYEVNGKKYAYKKICFANRSIPLLQFIKETLEELGLRPKMVDNVANKRVWLYNTKEVKTYLEKVGTNNPRLLK